MNEVDLLIELAQKIGKNIPLWTQGQGSNVSAKLGGDSLAIKATGLRLDEVKSQDQLAKLNASKLRAGLLEIQEKQNNGQLSNSLAEAKYADLIHDAKLGDGPRASMESGFHALLPKKFVAHFHALSMIVFSFHVEQGDFSEEQIEKHTDLKIKFLPYLRPGLSLSAIFTDSSFCNYDVFVLANHGVIFQFDEISDFERFISLEQKVRSQLRETLSIELPEQFENDRAKYSGIFHHYFPDAAIFEKQIKAALNFNHEKFIPQHTMPPNYFEIWQAIQVLARVCPNLTELNQQEVATLQNLPTELARVRAIASGEKK